MPADVESMFSVREVPWHGFGTIVEEQLTAEEALKASGLDWTVEKSPVYVKTGERYTKVPRKFLNVRSTDQKVLGAVGGAYTVLQNEDAFAFADGLVDSGEAKYETAGSLKGGQKVWVMMTIPSGIQIAGEDVDLYLALQNSHDGKSAVTVMVTPVRVVCTNTLNLALERAQRTWSVRHVGDLDGRIAEARRALDLTFSYVEEFKTVGEQLAASPFSPREFARLVQQLEPNEKSQDLMIEAYQESPNLANIRETKWGALNSIGEYADWIRPQRSPEARYKNATTGVGRKMRDAAMEILTAA